MAYVRFKHQDGKHDMVRFTGFQVCLDRGKVNDFYRPSEGKTRYVGIWLNSYHIAEIPQPSLYRHADVLLHTKV